MKTAVASSCGREPLVDTIVRFLAHERVADAREIRDCVEQAIDEFGPGAIDSLSASLSRAGADWAYYPCDPLARRIHHALAPRVLQPEPVVIGACHLDAVKGKPLVIFANHLSYSDANVVEVILRNAGAGCLANRLTAIAGPRSIRTSHAASRACASARSKCHKAPNARAKMR